MWPEGTESQESLKQHPRRHEEQDRLHLRGFGRKDFQVRLSVRAADRRLGFPGREAGGSSARPGHACFSVRRNAAVQRGKAMLVSRFAGVQHARRRAALQFKQLNC